MTEDPTQVELTFKQTKQLPWFEELVIDLKGTDMEEIEKYEPSFKFFKDGEAEMFVGQDQSNSSDGYVSIGAVGVGGDEWESFLEELEEVEDDNLYKGWTPISC
jgi:hypothetical protein